MHEPTSDDQVPPAENQGVRLLVASARAGVAGAFLIGYWIYRYWNAGLELSRARLLIGASWVVIAVLIVVAWQWATRKQWSWMISFIAVVVAMVGVAALSVTLLRLRLEW